MASTVSLALTSIVCLNSTFQESKNTLKHVALCPFCLLFCCMHSQKFLFPMFTWITSNSWLSLCINISAYPRNIYQVFSRILNSTYPMNSLWHILLITFTCMYIAIIYRAVFKLTILLRRRIISFNLIS